MVERINFFQGELTKIHGVKVAKNQDYFDVVPR